MNELIHGHDPLQLIDRLPTHCCSSLVTSEEEAQEAEEVAPREDDHVRRAQDPGGDVSCVGGQDEADVDDVHAVANDGDHEREVGEGAADPAAAAREPGVGRSRASRTRARSPRRPPRPSTGRTAGRRRTAPRPTCWPSA